MRADLKAFGDALLATVKGYFEQSIDARLKEIPAGKDGAPGRDADMAALSMQIDEAITKAVAALPMPKDGAPGPSVSQEALDRAVKAAIDAIPRPLDGKEGTPGRDAFELDVIPAIDEARSYPRGTVAEFNGGLVRAVRNTDPPVSGDLTKAGWVSIVRGVASLEVLQTNGRDFRFDVTFSDGKKETKSFTIPTLIYRGVFKDGPFEPGDTVTWDGSLWHCEEPTTDKPGTSKAWKICAKRGRDGKDGIHGKDGKDGRITRAEKVI